MSSLEAVFTRCKKAGRSSFIPFLTAGDPSLEATGQVVQALVDAGADIVEIGFPYSDPLADGPVIQASYARALAAGTKLDGIFTAAATWTKQFPNTPFVAMTSYSLVQRRGLVVFLDALKNSGFTGLIVPDLPLEETAALTKLAQDRQLSFIQLVTPTTPPERAKEIAQKTTGFLYVVSVTGITGTREALPVQLTSQLGYLRSITNLPLCVGFGISTPEQAARLKGQADGIIVGSALVRCLEGGGTLGGKLGNLSRLAKGMKEVVEMKCSTSSGRS